jgi:hypothetical protein
MGATRRTHSMSGCLCQTESIHPAAKRGAGTLHPFISLSDHVALLKDGVVQEVSVCCCDNWHFIFCEKLDVVY